MRRRLRSVITACWNGGGGGGGSEHEFQLGGFGFSGHGEVGGAPALQPRGRRFFPCPPNSRMPIGLIIPLIPAKTHGLKIFLIHPTSGISGNQMLDIKGCVKVLQQLTVRRRDWVMARFNAGRTQESPRATFCRDAVLETGSAPRAFGD